MRTDGRYVALKPDFDTSSLDRADAVCPFHFVGFYKRGKLKDAVDFLILICRQRGMSFGGRSVLIELHHLKMTVDKKRCTERLKPSV
jgi:hypothetical protein